MVLHARNSKTTLRTSEKSKQPLPRIELGTLAYLSMIRYSITSATLYH
jgi:hypothetical protein